MALYSVTERGTFKRCLREHRLTSRNGMHLGPIVSPVSLSTGTLIHEGSQHWLLDPSQSYETHVTVASARMLDNAHARYKAQVGAEMSSAEDDVLYEAITFARAMARNYELRWGTPLPDGFTLIRPEQRAQIPVAGTEHPCESCGGAFESNVPCLNCHGNLAFRELHYLDMRFDGLIQDKAGRIHVLEHKTYKSRPNMKSLESNDQFLAYMWGARKLGLGPVGGLAYDGLWRRETVPKGKTFEDLFLRTTLLRPEAEFEEFERLLTYELNDMWAMREAVRPMDTLPINRQWQGCFDCKFEPLCKAMSRGEDYSQMLRTTYTVRTDDADETEDEAEPAA